MSDYKKLHDKIIGMSKAVDRLYGGINSAEDEFGRMIGQEIEKAFKVKVNDVCVYAMMATDTLSIVVCLEEEGLVATIDRQICDKVRELIGRVESDVGIEVMGSMPKEDYDE